MTDYHIWKATLDRYAIGRIQIAALPVGSTVLSVGEQDGELVVWFQFVSENANRPTEDRKFLVTFTGGPTAFPDSWPLIFKGTVQIGQFVFHVFSVS